MSLRFRSILVLLAAAAPLFAEDYEFEPLVGSDGRTRLSEFYGSPVVVAGFRRHIPDGLHASWLAHVLTEKFRKKGLVVILRDQKPWRAEHHGALTRSFWARFFDSSPWLTCRREGERLPFRNDDAEWTDGRIVLVGVDGRTVLEGVIEKYEDRPRRDGFQARFTEAVEDELDKRRKGWGEDRKVRRARALLFGKDEIARAWKTLARIREDDVTGEVERARSEVRTHVATRVRAVERLLARGRYGDAEEAFEELEKSVRGEDAFEENVAKLEQRFDSDDVRAGLKAARSLDRLLRPLERRDFDALDAKRILRVRALGKEHEGTPVAKRVERLDPFLRAVWAALRGIRFSDSEKRILEEG